MSYLHLCFVTPEKTNQRSLSVKMHSGLVIRWSTPLLLTVQLQYIVILYEAIVVCQWTLTMVLNIQLCFSNSSLTRNSRHSLVNRLFVNNYSDMLMLFSDAHALRSMDIFLIHFKWYSWCYPPRIRFLQHSYINNLPQTKDPLAVGNNMKLVAIGLYSVIFFCDKIFPFT